MEALISLVILLTLTPLLIMLVIEFFKIAKLEHQEKRLKIEVLEKILVKITNNKDKK